MWGAMNAIIEFLRYYDNIGLLVRDWQNTPHLSWFMGKKL